MKLLVIRHGAAMDQKEFARTGASDDLRPLTTEGEAELRRVANGLRGEVRTLSVLATSPLVRARQTAQIIADAFGMGAPEITNCLVPGASMEEFEKWASAYSGDTVVAIVGHEPHLSTLVTWLLTGKAESRVRLKKAGACGVEFESAPQSDSGILSWLLTPRQLESGSRPRSE
jgi:phosphohistidine phosphatase